MGKRFLIYAAIGMLMEIAWTGIWGFIGGDVTCTGHTSVWMLPIYGAVVLIEPLFRAYGDNKSIFRFILYGTLIIAVEYYSGLLYVRLGICSWDYTQAKYNIDGLIRLDYYPLWIAVGAVYEQIFKRLTRVRGYKG